MKAVLLVATLALPGIVHAQSANRDINPPPSIGMHYSQHARSAESYSRERTLETPTMRREKLARAIALREEAAQMLARNGGKLTPEYTAYVRQKSHEILSYQR